LLAEGKPAARRDDHGGISRRRREQAKLMPGKRNGILRLHFCQWTDADTAWMTREALEPCLADFDPAEHYGKRIAKAWTFAGPRSHGESLDRRDRNVNVGVEVNVDGEVKTVEKPTYRRWIEAWTPGDTVRVRAIATRHHTKSGSATAT
jgi:hypothetical protein